MPNASASSAPAAATFMQVPITGVAVTCSSARACFSTACWPIFACRRRGRGWGEHVMSAESKKIFHYTDQAGLEGILKNQCLHATHFGYLNDESESKIFPMALKRSFEPFVRKWLEET